MVNKKAIFILFFILLPTYLFATSKMTTVFRTKSSKIFIEDSSNYDMFNHDILFEFQHEVEILDRVRADLVKQHKIENIPVVISMPSSIFGDYPEYTSISFKKNYDLGSDDSGYAVPLSNCYLIEFISAPSFENFVASLLLLEKLGADNNAIEIKDLEYEKKAFVEEIKTYKNFTQEIPFKLSCKGLALKGLWRDGNILLELEDLKTGDIINLEPLNGYMAAYPVCSLDGRYIAYASLQEVKMYDRVTKITKTFLLKSTVEYIDEVFVTFNNTNNTLIFSCHAMSTNNSKEYSYDITQQKISEFETEGKPKAEWYNPQYPSQPEESINVEYISPDGQYILKTAYSPGKIQAVLWSVDQEIKTEKILARIQWPSQENEVDIFPPVWSPDSRYITLASSREVKIYDTVKQEILSPEILEIYLISSTLVPGKLMIMLSDGIICAYDFEQRIISPPLMDAERGEWPQWKPGEVEALIKKATEQSQNLSVLSSTATVEVSSLTASVPSKVIPVQNKEEIPPLGIKILWWIKVICIAIAVSVGLAFVLRKIREKNRKG